MALAGGDTFETETHKAMLLKGNWLHVALITDYLLEGLKNSKHRKVREAKFKIHNQS